MHSTASLASEFGDCDLNRKLRIHRQTTPLPSQSDARNSHPKLPASISRTPKSLQCIVSLDRRNSRNEKPKGFFFCFCYCFPSAYACLTYAHILMLQVDQTFESFNVMAPATSFSYFRNQPVTIIENAVPKLPDDARPDSSILPD